MCWVDEKDLSEQIEAARSELERFTAAFEFDFCNNFVLEKSMALDQLILQFHAVKASA
ncbi:Spo0E family sporulation regulatory protein-aspartic acid phosphatase [Paenibacillus tepidiphilus]|uniref:Spo0E family sporulation regulatory protein-aspartic acid phosphatase n=1 Tax=Paenibacillus tepidiphilus TaxID=2608683 RepID=UPI00123909C0|nr:Spo0E family sporulation regulatory protein-aspartic acid phosphatase [Paenibacillus tepidiphilus]